MLFNHPGYTLAAGLLALVFAGLIWTVGRQRWPRTVVILIIAGVGSLLASQAGRLAHSGILRVEGGLDHVTGALFGVVFPGIVALVLAAVVGFHLHHRNVGRGTLAAAAGLPLTASLVPGIAGTVLVGIVTFLSQAVGYVGYLLFSSIHI